eukprot:819710-Lingulodinium_polyedra.AAC.1
MRCVWPPVIPSAAKVWPTQDDAEFGFMDVNPWLSMIIACKNGDPSSMKNPWCKQPRTLVGSATVVVRLTVQKRRLIRVIEGWEYMALLGWPVSAWAPGKPFPPR